MGDKNTKMPCDQHTVLIEQILSNTSELKAEIRAMKTEAKEDRKEIQPSTDCKN